MPQLTPTGAIVLIGSFLWLSALPLTSSKRADVSPLRSQEIDWSPVGLGERVTVLIFLEPECPACIGSMPFLKRLMTIRGLDGKAGRLIAIARNGVIPVKALIDEQGFKPHRLTSGPAGAATAVHSAPAVLVLDGAGKRAGLWSGRLTNEQQREVIELIARQLG